MISKISQRIKTAGRILMRGAEPYSKQREVPAITEDEVREAREFFPLEKFFIFGHARSGTTLLTRLVRVHPKVHCNYQGHFFTRPPTLEALVDDENIGFWLARRSNRWNRGRDLSPLVLRAASDFIMERDARKAGKGDQGCQVGDKSPNSLLNGKAVHLLIKVYPDARLIFIVRDGRDAILSHRFQAFIDTPHGLSREDIRLREEFTLDPKPFLSGQRSIFTEKTLRRGAQGWARNVTETDHVAKELLGKRYYSLRFEDLLTNPPSEMRELWTFLGVDPDTLGITDALDAEISSNPDADWQLQKAGDLTASLKKGKTGSWREMFTERDRQIFNEIAGNVLADWRYTE
jgi:hypothetical protein